jgi:hypothetical protein
MKIKTSDLTGPALDWAVAKCEGEDYAGLDFYVPSQLWDQGGPIIERECVSLQGAHGVWVATCIGRGSSTYCEGPTPLVAVMRGYVACQLGDEIDIPEELL